MTVKKMKTACFCLFLLFISDGAFAFVPRIASSHSIQSGTTLSATSPQKNGEFEYQELKIQTRAIVDQEVTTVRLAAEKRAELEAYVRRIVNRRESPVPLYEITPNDIQGKWQLAFTTQALSVESLPRDAIIKLDFQDQKSVDYILEFSKTFGLNRLVAKSSYTIDSTPVNPGLVTYTYDSISTDVFGLTNVGVGLFGMLQGRSSYIQTAYFDGDLWIEGGTDASGEYFNVYVRLDD